MAEIDSAAADFDVMRTEEVWYFLLHTACQYNGGMPTSANHGPALLTTKFFPPVRPQHAVARPQLVAHLQAGLAAGHPLTLVAAPAGYGKSTLAADWLADSGRPTTWLSLGEADDDPRRFFIYFIAALQRVDPAIGADLFPTLQAGQLPPSDVLLTTLVNDLLAVASPCLCVLDDFQAIQDPAIMAVLHGLVAQPATGLHLVLLTREDPALPLARLRARDQLTEVRAADLRFGDAEVAAFLCDRMGLSLSASDLAGLTERTEGWPAGVQLAGLALQRSHDPAAFVASLSGSHRFILGYLTEEVLKAQPHETQDFLRQTSVLTQLSPGLCDALTGRSDSATRLASLLAANLFLIPLDETGQWYRYHHLFADLLRSELQRIDPALIPVLHARASRWYESEGRPVEAIEHALAAAETGRVIDLLERYGWTLINQGQVRILETWRQALPAEARAASPRISLDLAWMALLRGDFSQVVPFLSQAEEVLGTLDPAAPATFALQAECLALRSNLLQYQSQLPEAITAATRARLQIPATNVRVAGLAALGLGGAYRQAGDFDQGTAALRDAIRASQASGDLVTEMLAVAHLVLMSIHYGRLRAAAEVAEASLVRVERAQRAPPIVGAVHGALGLIYYEWNQIEAAHEHLQRGIRLGTISGHNASLIYTRVNLARIEQAEGRLEAAARTLDEARALLAHGAPGWVRPELIARQVSLAVARGDLVAAAAVLHQSGVRAEEPVTHQSDIIHLAWLRLLAAQGDARANGLAGRIIDAAAARQRNGTLLPALILAALVQAGSDRPASHDLLRRALALAEPEGIVRAFMDEGAPLARLLHAVGYPAWLPRLGSEAVAVDDAAPVVGTAAPHSPSLVEPLSARELEVLHLLAAGLTYAEIAARLVVSVNTVRFHVKEIYSKLGVNRQAQAVARAQDLGLL